MADPSAHPLTLKLRVHLVPVSVHLVINDLTTIVKDINAIWEKAGIQFALEDCPDEVSVNNWDHWPKPTDSDRAPLLPTDGAIHGYYGYWVTPLYLLAGDREWVLLCDTDGAIPTDTVLLRQRSPD